MLTGFTKEELADKAKECTRRYEAKAIMLMQRAADYIIKDYDEMIDQLKELDWNYRLELEDYSPLYLTESVTDHLVSLLESYKESCSLQLAAMKWLDVFGAVKENHRSRWVNSDGVTCDEYGRPLSADGEHYVGEIIKGGKFKGD